MEIKSFKIRLSYFVYNTEHTINHTDVYVDETDDFAKLYNIRFEWNWLNVADDYTGIEKEYHENFNKLYHGYNDNDVYMDVQYKDGFCQVELLFNTPSDTLVTVYDHHKKRLITRTLFDWVKISINGSLSDGIGENEVAYYENKDNDVWFAEILTDEQTDDDNSYFYIGDPIQIVDDYEIVKLIEFPNYMERRKQISETYKGDADRIYDEYIKLNNEVQQYMLNKIKDVIA